MNQDRISVARLLAESLILVACSMPGAVGQEPSTVGHEAQMDRATRLYTPASWPSSGLRPGLALSELEFEGFRGEPLRNVNGQIERRYAGEKGLSAFVIELRVSDSAAKAHKVLLTWLASLSGLGKVPRGTDLDIPVGDVGYVGLSGAGPGAISWIAFVRGNVAIRILAGDPRQVPRPDLAAIAEKVDSKLVQGHQLGKGSQIPRPTILGFGADRATCTAGEIVPLRLEVNDPAGGPHLVTWIVGGPGQGYVERREDGVWRLYTTAPGAIHLIAEVTGKMGTTTTRAIDLVVTDERPKQGSR